MPNKQSRKVATKAKPPYKQLKTKAKTRRMAIRSNRALHLKISLHPISVLVYLCVGVLLIASTINVFGDSFSLTATVPAVLPPEPALITLPADGSTQSVSAVEVSGTCPAASYVELDVNSIFVGVADCSDDSFAISALLSVGANSLNVQDYNVTNQAGPTSAAITVNYSPPAPSTPSPGTTTSNPGPPIVAPTILDLTKLDSGVIFNNSSSLLTTSPRPTFSGIAPPLSLVTLLVHSKPVVCQTRANSIGYWTCSLDSSLPVGLHTIVATSQSSNGQIYTTPIVKFLVALKAVANLSPVKNTSPLIIASSYAYQVYKLGQSVPLSLTFSGGTPPYTVSINWGDGQTQSLQSQDSSFSASHKFNNMSEALGAYNVRIQVVDSQGKTAAIQLLSVVRNQAYLINGTTNLVSTTNHSLVSRILLATHSWLWLLWPGYGIVLLMIISFWLGERQQYQTDYLRRNQRSITKNRRHKLA